MATSATFVRLRAGHGRGENSPASESVGKESKPFSHFCTFKRPKLRIKMAAQSCMFSTDANADKETNF